MKNCKYGECITRISPTVTTTCPFMNRYKAKKEETGEIGFVSFGSELTTDNCLDQKQRELANREMRFL